jgi:hypothetical protein
VLLLLLLPPPPTARAARSSTRPHSGALDAFDATRTGDRCILTSSVSTHPPFFKNAPRALEATSAAALALYGQLKKQQPPPPPMAVDDGQQLQLLREYEAAFARVASALATATATATATAEGPPAPARTAAAAATTAAVAAEEEEEEDEEEDEDENGEKEEDRTMLARLLERYSERLVALVERKVKGEAET